MSFFESYENLMAIFLFIPLAISTCLSYLTVIKNYGSVINIPEWKKAIGAISCEIFFISVLVIFFYKYIKVGNWKMLIIIALTFVCGIIFLIIKQFIPQIDNWFHKITKEEDAKANNQDTDTAKRSVKKISGRGEKITDYIGIILSAFSRFTFGLYIIITISLRIIIQYKQSEIDANTIVQILTCWEITALIISVIETLVRASAICAILTEPKPIPDDTALNRIKERLSE